MYKEFEMYSQLVVVHGDALPQELCGMNRAIVAVLPHPSGATIVQRVSAKRGARADVDGGALIEMWSSTDDGELIEAFRLQCERCYAPASIDRVRMWRSRHLRKPTRPLWFCCRDCRTEHENPKDGSKKHGLWVV